MTSDDLGLVRVARKESKVMQSPRSSRFNGHPDSTAASEAKRHEGLLYFGVCDAADCWGPTADCSCRRPCSIARVPLAGAVRSLSKQHSLIVTSVGLMNAAE